MLALLLAWEKEQPGKCTACLLCHHRALSQAGLENTIVADAESFGENLSENQGISLPLGRSAKLFLNQKPS